MSGYVVGKLQASGKGGTTDFLVLKHLDVTDAIDSTVWIKIY